MMSTKQFLFCLCFVHTLVFVEFVSAQSTIQVEVTEDPSGDAIKYARVNVAQNDEDDPDAEADEEEDEYPKHGRTGPAGVCEIKQNPDGSYTVTVSAVGYVPSKGKTKQIEIDGDDVDVSLTLARGTFQPDEAEAIVQFIILGSEDADDLSEYYSTIWYDFGKYDNSIESKWKLAHGLSEEVDDEAVLGVPGVRDYLAVDSGNFELLGAVSKTFQRAIEAEGPELPSRLELSSRGIRGELLKDLLKEAAMESGLSEAMTTRFLNDAKKKYEFDDDELWRLPDRGRRFDRFK